MTMLTITTKYLVYFLCVLDRYSRFYSVVNDFICILKQQYYAVQQACHVAAGYMCCSVCVLIFCWSSHISVVLG